MNRQILLAAAAVLVIAVAGLMALMDAGDEAGSVQLPDDRQRPEARSDARGATAPVAQAATTTRDATTTRTATAGRASADDEKYDIVVTRNIFLRSRRAPRERTAAPPPPPRAERREPTRATVVREKPKPGRDFALRGVGVHGARRVAYVEDLRTSSAVGVRVGDLIAGSRVTAIELDYVELTSQEEEPLRIAVGQDLTGETAKVVFVPGNEIRPRTTASSRRDDARGYRGREDSRRGRTRGREEDSRAGFGRTDSGGEAGPGGAFQRGEFEAATPMVVTPDELDTMMVQPIEVDEDDARVLRLRQQRLRELQAEDDDVVEEDE